MAEALDGSNMHVIPRWTIPSFRRTAGLYPLGLEAVAMGQLGTDLAPGLPVISQHPRYWSIYTFILRRYWEIPDARQTHAAFGRYLKMREPFFATAALRCRRHRPLLGVIGSNSFGQYANRPADENLTITPDYLGNSLGGYGAVYRGAMQELGIVLLAERMPSARMDAPYGDLGLAIANAFQDAIAHTEYFKKYLDSDIDEIPLAVIDELAEVSCFCQLVNHEPERALLTDVLMGRVQQRHSSHSNRAETIKMILDIAESIDGEPLNEDRFRQLLYFNQDIHGHAWAPRDSSVETWRRWRLIQLRDYVVRGLNALFVDFSRWGVDAGGTVQALNLGSYAARVRAMELPLILEGNRRLDLVSIGDVIDKIDHQIAIQGWPVDGPLEHLDLTEHRLTSMHAWGTNPDTPVLATLALLVAWRRQMTIRTERDFDFNELRMFRDKGDGRRSTADVFNWLEQRCDVGGTIDGLVVDLVREIVIREHLRTARGKLPENTFRFHDEPEGFRFVDHGDTGIGSISIRFNAISQAMSGLGLVAAPLTEPGHQPTELGLAELNG